MKYRNLYKEGDQVEIIRTHGDDLGKIGTITEVRCSFCKIDIEGKIVNHTYKQFRKVNEPSEEERNFKEQVDF